MDPTQFTLVTQPAAHNPSVSMPVQEQSHAPSLRPGPSTFPDDSFDAHGFRKDRKTVPALSVKLKAKTPQGRYAEWAFEVCPSHTVAELKARVALFVAHRLWGGAYREYSSQAGLSLSLRQNPVLLSHKGRQLRREDDDERQIFDTDIEGGDTLIVLNSPNSFLRWADQRHERARKTWGAGGHAVAGQGAHGGKFAARAQLDPKKFNLERDYVVCRVCGLSNDKGSRKCECCKRPLAEVPEGYVYGEMGSAQRSVLKHEAAAQAAASEAKSRDKYSVPVVRRKDGQGKGPAGAAGAAGAASMALSNAASAVLSKQP